MVLTRPVSCPVSSLYFQLSCAAVVSVSGGGEVGLFDFFVDFVFDG